MKAYQSTDVKSPKQPPANTSSPAHTTTTTTAAATATATATGQDKDAVVVKLECSTDPQHSKTLRLTPTDPVLKIGRQVSPQVPPSPTNGVFDSKVLSRQHAELFLSKTATSMVGFQVLIRDVGSSNGTFVNGQRLSPESQASDYLALKNADSLEFGVDIMDEEGKKVIYKKVALRIGIVSAGASPSVDQVQPSPGPVAALQKSASVSSIDSQQTQTGQKWATADAVSAAQQDIVLSLLEVPLIIYRF